MRVNQGTEGLLSQLRRRPPQLPAWQPRGFDGIYVAQLAAARLCRSDLTDGVVRDVDEIRDLGFPIFAAGVSPLNAFHGSPSGVAQISAESVINFQKGNGQTCVVFAE